MADRTYDRDAMPPHRAYHAHMPSTTTTTVTSTYPGMGPAPPPARNVDPATWAVSDPTWTVAPQSEQVAWWTSEQQQQQQQQPQRQHQCAATGRAHAYNQAEEYLASAKWALVKSPSSNLAVQAKLARNFGLLYHSRHQSRDAAAYLARAIFYASQHLGDPDHIHVAGAYFQLGQVFADDNKVPAATAAFGRVLGMWARWVRRLVAEASAVTAEGSTAAPVVPWSEQVANMLGAFHSRSSLFNGVH
ncbi:hypothetical protein AMAG_19394 [Allomyces macrogynus ATCC 38327]|uniref:Uncharacterized protein n=1 Tax=Allomyces macrogynus (strain ATCC 38327) TaxID=578462 RepID=A0A0L0SR93_ALLM3|nr:hypothetical protein AMAG_19394 [Allomyces macrogynus ATCC 38327]|eukprot:KNE64894.1 hypothetical protein AMAG_19394 [Allomyces macrogynus ATCC 38327]